MGGNKAADWRRSKRNLLKLTSRPDNDLNARDFLRKFIRENMKRLVFMCSKRNIHSNMDVGHMPRVIVVPDLCANALRMLECQSNVHDGG